jgi:hypothetical protein
MVSLCCCLCRVVVALSLCALCVALGVVVVRCVVVVRVVRCFLVHVIILFRRRWFHLSHVVSLQSLMSSVSIIPSHVAPYAP